MTEREKEMNHVFFRFADELPLTILIAEDNLINQKLLIKILDGLGYKPDWVSNGQEAVIATQKKKYDLVLMDIQMPVMNGEDAAAELRKAYKSSCPKVIAVTAYAMHGDRERFISGGMDGYVSKPFRMQELVNEMKRVMLKSSDKRSA